MSKTCILTILAVLTAGVALAEDASRGAFAVPEGAQSFAVAAPEASLGAASSAPAEEDFVTLADGCSVSAQAFEDSFVLEALRYEAQPMAQTSSFGGSLEGCDNCRVIAFGARCCGCTWRNTTTVCKTSEGTRGVLQVRICSWVRPCPPGQTCEIQACTDCQASGYRCI